MFGSLRFSVIDHHIWRQFVSRIANPTYIWQITTLILGEPYVLYVKFGEITHYEIRIRVSPRRYSENRIYYIAPGCRVSG